MHAELQFDSSVDVCAAADSTVHNPKMQDVELGKKGEA